MQTFPRLFKITKTGATQQWTIWVEGSTIHTQWGQVNGKLQTTTDVIRSGKNISQSNETSREEQAQLEAKALWNKQIKKGYVEDISKQSALGGVAPMLAHSFSKQEDKIKYPCFIQPKLDGIRCIAMITNGVCTLWSRTRKPITSVPHIVKVLEGMFPSQTVILDGELYSHELRESFEYLISIVRQETPREDCNLIQYHVYDMVREDAVYYDRWQWVQHYIKSTEFIVPVLTMKVLNPVSLKAEYEKFLDLGYEGAIVRNAAGRYINSRSYDLQKMKQFEDTEFEVIGVEEGRGKLAGHAVFICKTTAGESFTVKMKGAQEKLKDYLKNPPLGQLLTVQYQGITNKNGVPRFPVGLRIQQQ